VTTTCLLRHQAEEDLESIWLYSYTEWGRKQADQYLQNLLSRIQWLSENPRIGKERADIKPGYYYFPEGAHLVFYKIIPDGIDIIGIPHQNMDIGDYLDS